jgi:aspartyl-tRNA(Asn)/glutamyl-tRNA(Gln) amidotransferase subunit A
MEPTDIPFLSATELGDQIRQRNLSPVEACQAYLDRIGQVDEKLNSYITVCGDQALADARQAEADIARGDYKGPMHGIPVAVKDQFNTRGILTTAGSTILKDFIPGEDSTVIAKLKEAGSILLGKLNMSEFAMGDAFPHPYGRPHNPWDLERNPGTSSSGSGAATAAFLCATSIGEDTGGSIRGPATFCGLVGIRPSQGRVSRHGMLGAVWSMDQGGPISRTVADCAITLEAIAGHDPKDPYTWNVPVPRYTDALDGDIGGIKVGVIRELMDHEAVETDIGDAVRSAISSLGELGATVQDVSIPLIASSSVIFGAISQVEGAAVQEDWIRERLDDYDHNVRIRQLTGSVIPAQAYYRAQKLRTLLREQMLEALDRVDVLVLPTSPIPAPKIPASAGIGSKAEAKAVFFGRRSFTNPGNLAGVPALSVPCGFTSTTPELPIGLQIMGRPFDEATVLKVAHAYEQGSSWHTRRPPI